MRKLLKDVFNIGSRQNPISATRYGFEKGGKFILHREEGPACIDENGLEIWALSGNIIKKNLFNEELEKFKELQKKEFVCLESVTNTTSYSKLIEKKFGFYRAHEFILHREDGPALIESLYIRDKFFNETSSYYINDELCLGEKNFTKKLSIYKAGIITR
jgi:hypothetical protein